MHTFPKYFCHLKWFLEILFHVPTLLAPMPRYVKSELRNISMPYQVTVQNQLSINKAFTWICILHKLILNYDLWSYFQAIVHNHDIAHLLIIRPLFDLVMYAILSLLFCAKQAIMYHTTNAGVNILQIAGTSVLEEFLKNGRFR